MGQPGGVGEMHGGLHLGMEGLQQQQQQHQGRGEEQQQFDGQQHQQHGQQQMGQQGEIINQSPRGQGIGGQGGTGQGQEVSQLDFEDALGARLMESLEDHDKRAASVTTS
jgi:hypothetical protein